MYNLDLEMAEETEIKLPTWIMQKAKEFQKDSYYCFIDYAKSFDCVDHNKMWRILTEMRVPNHLTCLLRNLYAKYVMLNARLNEAQVGIKIVGRNIHNLRYADGTTLIAES